ncbi:MAG: hypothetical protein JWO45_1868 [Spartobacteria bacterium]|nr:hypothetical protein [Spartobacteria bacterium]
MLDGLLATAEGEEDSEVVAAVSMVVAVSMVEPRRGEAPERASRLEHIQCMDGLSIPVRPDD